MLHSSSTIENRSARNLLPGLVIGFVGAVVMATLTLAAGHGIIMALLAYSLTGALLLLTAIAARLVLDAAASRLAPVVGFGRGALGA